MRTEYLMTIYKILASLLYSVISTSFVVQRNDSYEAVFTDPFFWIAAILGTALMLLFERADPKMKTPITRRRIAFSIVACFSAVFILGTFRASSLEDVEFKRNHWFYGIVIFVCAIAPELIRLIISDSPGAVSRGFNRGIERRIDKTVGGDDFGNNHQYDMNLPAPSGPEETQKRNDNYE